MGVLLLLLLMLLQFLMLVGLLVLRQFGLLGICAGAIAGRVEGLVHAHADHARLEMMRRDRALLIHIAILGGCSLRIAPYGIGIGRVGRGRRSGDRGRGCRVADEIDFFRRVCGPEVDGEDKIRCIDVADEGECQCGSSRWRHDTTSESVDGLDGMKERTDLISSSCFVCAS